MRPSDPPTRVARAPGPVDGDADLRPHAADEEGPTSALDANALAIRRMPAPEHEPGGRAGAAGAGSSAADADGPTLDRPPQPSDGEARTVPLPSIKGQLAPRAGDAPSTALGDGEERTLPRAPIAGDPLAAPPAKEGLTVRLPTIPNPRDVAGASALGDDVVPVTEGTTLLPQAEVRAALAAEDDHAIDVHVSGPLPPIRGGTGAARSAATSSERVRSTPRTRGRGRAIVLWIVGSLLMACAAWYVLHARS